MRKKMILIADDDRELVHALVARCRQMGLGVLTAHDALSALQVFNSFIHVDGAPPDLVCLDVNMPAGNGLSVCEMIASDADWSTTPIIILTGNKNQDTIRRCHEMCANYVLKTGDVWRNLEPLICKLLDISSAPSNADVPGNHVDADGSPDDAQSVDDDPVLDAIFTALGANENYLGGENKSGNNGNLLTTPWILHVDDDAEMSAALQLRLEAHGVSVVRAHNGMQGVQRAFTHPADAIILDYEMPRGDGEYVLRRLKTNPLTRNIPVIILTGRKEENLKRKLLSLGAAQFFSKPPVFDDLLSELKQLLECGWPITT